MRAFKVHLNGKRLCVAGVDGDGVLAAITNYVSGRGGTEIFLHVGGLRSPNDEHVRWVRQKRLRVGDEIRITILEAATVDAPREKHRTDPTQRLAEQKRYVRQMAKRLGWRILTQGTKPKTS